MNIEHDKTMKKMETDHIIMQDQKVEIIHAKRDDLDDIEHWMEKKDEKLEELSTLVNELDRGREKHEENLGIIKKERAAAIDKLRKEMLMNIRNVKMQMLDMNQDQLQGTTKLTVNQNLQLSSELEYQSQHIEQLTYQNDKLQEQMKELKSELDQHAEVENELAKRSHFCNQVIKKYKTQIKLLKEEIQERQSNGQKPAPKAEKLDAVPPSTDFSKSDLTQFLQKRIMDYERKQ